MFERFREIIGYNEMANKFKEYAIDYDFYQNGEIELILNTTSAKFKEEFVVFFNNLIWINYQFTTLTKNEDGEDEYKTKIRQTHFEIVENLEGSNIVILSYDRNPLYDDKYANVVLSINTLYNKKSPVKLYYVQFGSKYKHDMNININNNIGFVSPYRTNY